MNSLNVTFLTIGQENVSLAQVLQYLQVSGRLVPFMQEIVSQHVLFQEMQQRQDLSVNHADLEQAIINFRLQQNLGQPEEFQNWMAMQGMDYPLFQTRMALKLKFEKLKELIAESNLETYFADNRSNLDSVDLSCVIVNNKDLAFKIYQQLSINQTDFEQVITEQNLTEDPTTYTMRGPSRLLRLPKDLREVITVSTPGQLCGPLQLGTRWCIFRIERWIPAVLEGNLKKELQEQLFRRWLLEKLKKMNVKLALTNPNSSEVSVES
ncbi:peptidylprolyl isomerase [Anabaena minutissima FACHB-250]|nr:peptidylprolyl isomerase [Anabaena minutissima FACHB-250]